MEPPPPSVTEKQTHQTLLQPVANGRAVIFFFFSEKLAGPMRRGDEGRPMGGSLQNRAQVSGPLGPVSPQLF